MFRRQTLNAAQQWLLSFLVFVASFMHLYRSPEAGGLGLMSQMTAQMVSHEPQGTAHQQSAKAEQNPVLDEVRGDPNAKMDCLPPTDSAGHQAGHGHAPDLTTQAPNAPPAHSNHHSEAHCPFCFTAAFALEAVEFALPFDGLAAHRWAESTWISPALKLIRHAQARAPPHLPA